MSIEKRIEKLMKELGLTKHSTNLFHPNIGETSKRYFKLKSSTENNFKLFVFRSKILIDFPVDTSLLFSVNLPDLICWANKPLDRWEGGIAFTDRSKDDVVTDGIKAIETEILELKLGDGEGLFVYGNAIQLVVDGTRPLRPEIQIMQRISSKISHMYSVEKKPVDVSKIGTEFNDLIPLLSEWAISDDLERQQKIEEASKSELGNLVKTVAPKMNLINNYLNSFGEDPLPHEATLIGNLAELVSQIISADQAK